MKYLFILFLPLFVISGCSDKDEVPTPETSSADTSAAQPAAQEQVSEDNVFKGQLDALDTAKEVSETAQQSIDDSEQKLEEASDTAEQSTDDSEQKPDEAAGQSQP